MSRKPIQVTEEVKDELDRLQDQFRAKTTYETIEKLVRYYENNERWKKEERTRQEELERKRKATMIYIGEDLKSQYTELANELDLNESNALALLLHHYEQSPTLSKETFRFYANLK